MDSVTEVIEFVLKSADASEPLSDLLKTTLLQQPGCLRVRWGLTHEGKNKARCFIDWDNISQHEKFMAGLSYPALLQKLGTLVHPSSSGFHHVKFSPMPPSVLDNEAGKSKTPVAEVLYLYFQGDDGFTPDMKETATANAEQFVAACVPLPKGCTGETAMGWAIEKIDFKGEMCNALVLVIGWETVEDHMRYRATEGFQKSISGLQRTAGIKGVSVVHVSLATVERGD
ncbi:hypothetical protein GGS24DRAFT_477757 [Hypoxylon argillaceum]|nr:hypothetical protein GGS24DRAFT_477757 [Hypoxylon argillaceum]KAI1152424.1 hypothetical protein F4825DRAFT_418956 [Nemania diffusa]